MAKRRVSIPLNFGVNTALDRKIAPFGWLKSATNLRIRDRGQLGPRNGFAALDMTSVSGEEVYVYDLFEYKNRLCALGDEGGNGYPTEVFEYINQSQGAWRSSDPEKTRVMLNPFTNMRDIAGIPQAEGSVTEIDAAAGGGYVCLVYKFQSTMYGVIFKQDTDQVLYIEKLTATLLTDVINFKLFYSGQKFILAVNCENTGITVLKYTPTADTAWSVHIATVLAPSGADISAWDASIVTRPSAREIIFAAFDPGSNNISVKQYNASAVQQGSTFTVSSAGTIWVNVDSDETNNNLVLLVITGTETATITTYNFSGTIVAGPTAIFNGVNGSICRLFGQNSFGTSIAVVLNQLDGESAKTRMYAHNTHAAVGSTNTLYGYTLRSRLLRAQTPGQNTPIVHAGMVAPEPPSFENATNIISYQTQAHVMSSKRDFIKAMDGDVPHMMNITVDTITGKLCWPALIDPGIDGVAVPSVVLTDFQSSNRRQGVRFGQHYYLSGGTPSVYDGRINADLGFNEAPGIMDLTAGTSGSGNLTGGATYFYTVHWEYTLSDKSIMLSPVSVGGNAGQSISQANSVTLGGGDNQVSITATTPHHNLISIGDVLLGANVVLVISRTEWDPSLNAPKSVLRRCATVKIPSGFSNWGKPLTYVDRLSDTDLATQAPIYTQGDRGILSGPLEQNAPQPCSYITSSESRLFLGGLIRPSDVQVSREAFRGETISFSEFSNFFNQVNRNVSAVQNLDGSLLVFTEQDMYQIFGSGPDDLGGGIVQAPIEVASQGGLINNQGWRSLLKTDMGVFYQHSQNKLLVLPRGATSPQDIGEPIQGILDQYPIISGATRIKNDYLASFAVGNENNNDARLLTIDFHESQWLVDELPLETNGIIDSVVEYDSKLAYCSGGVVYYQRDDFADNGTDFIPTELITNAIYPFGLGGKGMIYDFEYIGENRSDCTLTLSVSYDDGQNWVAMSDVVYSGVTSGTTAKEQYTPANQLFSSVVFKLEVSGTDPGEGLIHNHIELWVEDESGLENLNPGQMHSNA